MFCSKTANNSINKIHKRTLRLVYDMDDGTFEDLLIKDKSRTVHDNNIHTLMVEIFKSVHHLSPPIMWDLFDLKPHKYNLRSTHLLKLPATKTSRYGIQALCFRGSLLWNSLPSKYKEITNLEAFKTQIKLWKTTTCGCKICK